MPRRSRIRFTPTALLLASVIGSSCKAEIPVGIFACKTANDCPHGFVCRTDPASDDLRCYATGTSDATTAGAGSPGDSDAGSAGARAAGAGGEAGGKAAGSGAGEKAGGAGGAPSPAGLLQAPTLSTLGERRAGGGLTLYDDGFEIGERSCSADGLCVTGEIRP
jgi:hypothetical protein